MAKLNCKNLSENEETEYDRIYFILQGTLKIEIDGQVLNLNSNDTIYISKGSSYKMIGTFETLVINSPAFGSIP